MASPTIHTFFDSPDPNAAPLNLTQLFELADLLVHSEFREEYTPYVLQNGEPGVEDQDKVWFEKDAQGRPVSIKVYWNGHWRRVYNGMMGEIRGYTGNPGTDFDSTGWGKVAGEYDGWHLCNGNDGAPDFSDQFLVGAHMNNEDHSGYVDSEWVSWIGDKTGMHVGGQKDVTLSDSNMFKAAGVIGELEVGRYGITPGGGETLDGTKPLFGKVSISDPTKNISLSVEATGSTEPTPVPTIPPFVALAWVIFMGYRT